MFPNELDGAKVLFYTEKEDFGTVNYPNGEICDYITYLAICTYPNASKDYYLFYCDDKYEVITDNLFNSLEDCKKCAEVRKKDIFWIVKQQ